MVSKTLIELDGTKVRTHRSQWSPRDFWEHPATLAKSVLVLPGGDRHTDTHSQLMTHMWDSNERPTMTHQKWMRLKPSYPFFTTLVKWFMLSGPAVCPAKKKCRSSQHFTALPVSRTSSCARSTSERNVGKVGVATCDSFTVAELGWRQGTSLGICVALKVNVLLFPKNASKIIKGHFCEYSTSLIYMESYQRASATKSWHSTAD